MTAIVLQSRKARRLPQAGRRAPVVCVFNYNHAQVEPGPSLPDWLTLPR